MPINDVILKNWALLDNAFKNIEDVIVDDNYNKVLERLQPFREDKQKRDTFLQIQNKLSTTDASLIPQTKDGTAEGLDTKGYAFANLDQTNAWKGFAEAYAKKNPQYDGKSPIDVNEFKSYLQEYPQHQDELRTAGILKQMPVKTPKTEEEYLNDYYTKAGLTPEQVKFYNDYKKEMTPATTQNEKLANFVSGYAPYLVSDGKNADSRLKYLGNIAGTLGFTDPKADEYEYKEVGGNLVKINKRTNKAEIIKVKADAQLKLNTMNASDMSKLTSDQILQNFSTDEIFAHRFDFAPEILAKLYETYPQWKIQDDEADALGKTGRLSRGSGVKRKGLGSFANTDDLGDGDPAPTEGTLSKTQQAENRNRERLKNSKGTDIPAKEIEKERKEIAGALKQFKAEYDYMASAKKGLDSPEFASWKNNVISYYNDLISHGYSNYVIGEVEDFAQKYYGFDIKKVRK